MASSTDPWGDKAPVIEPGHDFATVTDKIASIVLRGRQPLAWWIGVSISLLLLMMLLFSLGRTWWPRASACGASASRLAGDSASSTSSGGSASATPAR